MFRVSIKDSIKESRSAHESSDTCRILSIPVCFSKSHEPVVKPDMCFCPASNIAGCAVVSSFVASKSCAGPWQPAGHCQVASKPLSKRNAKGICYCQKKKTKWICKDDVKISKCSSVTSSITAQKRSLHTYAFPHRPSGLLGQPSVHPLQQHLADGDCKVTQEDRD